MPSITFVNMDGESKSFDLEETSNQDALLGGFDHLDKSIKKENKTNEMDLDPSTGQPNWFKDGNLSKYYETNN